MMRTLLSLLITIGLQQTAFAALGAHWQLQDNAASYTVVATVGTNGSWNGSVHTSSATSTPGPGTTLTRCFLLDGTDDYVSALTGNSAVLQNKSTFTLACWFKVASGDTTGDHRFIYVSSGAAASAFRAAIGINTSGQLTASAKAGDGEGTQGETTSNSYDDDTWHHMAAVVDIAGDAITIYVDGASVASSGTSSFTASATSNTASLALNCGSANATQYYKGRLADCRIYDSNESANLSAIMAEKDIAALIDPLSTSIPGSSADPLTGTIPGL